MAWKRDEIGYTGIAFPFALTPAGRVSISTVNLGEQDMSHITQAIDQLLSTAKGERFFNRGFGAKPVSLIFEPNTEPSVMMAASDIRDILEEYEPRVVMTEFVVVDSDPDEGRIKVRLGLFNTQTQVEDSVEVTIG